MHCYEIGENVGGLLVNREASKPYIRSPVGCALDLRLSKHTEALFQEAPEEWCYLERASVSFQGTTMVLDPEPLHQANACQQALLRVTVAAGVGGRVRLTAVTYDEVEHRGRVERHHRPFPSPGVTPLVVPEVLEDAIRGEELLDLLILLAPGAQLRMERDGQLHGASPEVYMQWTGRRLNVHARGAAGVGLTAAV